MTVKYETVVNGIGSMVDEIKSENMLILFGEGAPMELADFSLSINVNPIEETFSVGDTLILNGEKYKITAIGEAVEKNLTQLGHITLNFNGMTEAELPGTLYLEPKDIIDIKNHMSIKVEG